MQSHDLPLFCWVPPAAVINAPMGLADDPEVCAKEPIMPRISAGAASTDIEVEACSAIDRQRIHGNLQHTHQQREAQLPGTLAEALAAVAATEAMGGDALRRITSDLSVVAKVVGRPLADLPCAPPALRPFLRKARPGRYRMRPARWSSAKSSVARVLRLVGWIDIDVASRSPLCGRWQDAIDHFAQVGQKASFKGFARYCILMNVEPEAVSLTTLEDYGQWRADRTLILDISSSVTIIRRLWRELQRTLPSWPQSHISAPRDPRRYAEAPASFPQSFQDEVNALIASMATFKPLDARFSKRYSPATIRCTRNAIYRAATIIAYAKGHISAVRSLRDVLNPEAFKIVMLDHCDRVGDNDSWAPSSRTFADTLKRVAKLSGLFTEAESGELSKTTTLVKPPGFGLSRNSRDRVAQFFDPALFDRLNALPDRLMKEAGGLLKDGCSDRAARLYCRGLQLAVLIAHPLRRGTLATLVIDRHLLRDKSGKLTRLFVPANETKNGKAIEGMIDSELASKIETFIRLYRPAMLNGDSMYLWPGGHDGHLAPETVSRNLKKLVEDDLSVDFNVHIVRHLAATLMLEDNPRNMPLVQQILGHRDCKTTERIYGHARIAAAQKLWGETIEDRLSRGKGRRPR